MLNRTRQLLTALAAIGALLAASVATAPPAAAAPTANAAAAVSFTVNSTNDVPANFSGDPNFDLCQTGLGNQVCTLRAAIMNANRHASGPALIHLPAGTYTLAIASAAPFSDANGSLDISRTVTLLGAGAASTIIDGAALDSVFFVTASGVFTVTGVTIQHGHSGGGGAIASSGQLSLSDSVLRDNFGFEGGALNSAGSTTVNRTSFLDNLSPKFGGGIIVDGGSLSLSNSTVAGNSALDGGGIHNDGNLIVFNSTLSNNRTFFSGGALENAGTASLFHTTIAGNLADDDGNGSGVGGGIFGGFNPENTQLFNTLLADNYVSSTVNECAGQIGSHDYNLIQTTDDCSITLTTHDNSDLTDVFLGELANNGGPTLTRALLAGSPALDIIPATHNGPCRDPLGAAPVPDQRGVARPVNGLCDIGAFEGALPLPLFARNLVRNGDAEAGAGTSVYATVGAPTWFTNGPMTVVTYNAPGGFPSVPTDTVPANHGTNFFSGGLGPNATGIQRFDVSAAGQLIDTGQVAFVLSGDLGGFGADLDNASFSVSFQNALDQPTGVGRIIGPVTAADRASKLSGTHTGFIHRAAFGAVPVGTRVIFVQLTFTRFSGAGTNDDGYADNLSLVLRPPPLWLPLVVR